MGEPDFPRPARRKKCKALDLPGHADALTFSCYKRQSFLSRERSRLWTVEAIRRAMIDHEFHLWAYVLMPNHVHLLVCPVGPTYGTSEFLRSVKKSVANRAIHYVRRHSPKFLPRMTDHRPDGSIVYRFWQRARTYDRNLWEPRYVQEMIDYIHLNPVRRGLCERPEDWGWSSAADYAGTRTGRLKIDFHTLPPDPRP